MHRIEHRYSTGGSFEKPTIQVNGSVTPGDILDDLLSPAHLPEPKPHPLLEVRSDLIDAWARIGIILERGGVISMDGKIAIPIIAETYIWPKIPENSVRIEPSFRSHLRYEMRVRIGDVTKPFFFLKGEGDKKILINKERQAMTDMVNISYENFQVPYPRIDARSAVDQLLMSVVQNQFEN